MKIEYYKEYSENLNREMEFKIYGHDGMVILAFPAQAGRFYDFEDFKMIDTISDFIESGAVRVVSVDSIDNETFGSLFYNQHNRILMHENWFNYVNEELVASVKKKLKLKKKDRFITTGVSLGAYHALNFILRRPDLYSKCICLSGIYSAEFFFHDYNDELIYLNSPTAYLPNMSEDHELIKKYHDCEFIICVGQGLWEEAGNIDAWKLKAAFESKNVDAWVDFWGNDVNHDWPWWRKQFPYYVKHILEEQ